MSDSKTTIACESLSAAMDGEAQDLELRRLFRDISSVTELREKWFRYHLVSSIIQQGDYSPLTSFQLADSVQRAISQLDTPIMTRASVSAGEPLKARGWQRGAARFAVAASVAIAIVAGVQWKQGESFTPQVADSPRTNIQASRMEQSNITPSAFVSQPFLGVMPQQQEVSAQSDMIILYPLQKAALVKGRSDIPLAR